MSVLFVVGFVAANVAACLRHPLPLRETRHTHHGVPSVVVTVLSCAQPGGSRKFSGPVRRATSSTIASLIVLLEAIRAARKTGRTETFPSCVHPSRDDSVTPHGANLAENLVSKTSGASADLDAMRILIMNNAASGFTFGSTAVLADGVDRVAGVARPIKRAKAKARATTQNREDHPFAQQAEFTGEMLGRMAEVYQELNLLAARIEKSGAAAQPEARIRLQALREQTAQLNRQLGEFTNATEATWGDVKAVFEAGHAALKERFHDARQWASDRIAP